MKPHGGFEHNLQSLRVVDVLDERYGGFDGRNLCFETREGILKHCSVKNARQLGDVGVRFIERKQPLRSGLLTIEQMMEMALFARHAVECGSSASC